MESVCGVFYERSERGLSKEKKNKPVLPIYAIAAVWLLLSVRSPIASMFRIIWAIVLSVIVYNVVKGLIGDKDKEAKDTDTAKRAAAQPEKAAEKKSEPKVPVKEEPKYPPEVQAVVDEGKRARSELQRLYASIPDLAVKKKVQEIMDITDKIIADAIEDPGDVPQIKRFMDYYLPTTIKLLNAYDRMGAQGIEGSNISGTMQSIDGMLDTAIDAYKKLLDSLFANQAMDIETDIDVMNTLLRREGFAASGEGGMKL